MTNYCELANLPTCLLAHYTYYAFSPGASSPVSSPVSFLLVPFPRLVPPFRPVFIVSSSCRAIREAGRFFLIRSSHLPGLYSPRSAPFHQAYSFRRLVVPFRPIVSPVVCNVIFLYLTFAMLKAKK